MGTQYFTNAYSTNGRPHRIDIESLKVGGHNAYSLEARDLYKELVKAGCPKLTELMSKVEMLLRYGTWLEEGAEKAGAANAGN